MSRWKKSILRYPKPRRWLGHSVRRLRIFGQVSPARSTRSDAAATLLTNEITQGRDALSELDTRLAALEALSIRLQQVIPTVLLVIAVIISLMFAFVIFTQVEVIRLYIARWRG